MSTDAVLPDAETVVEITTADGVVWSALVAEITKNRLTLTGDEIPPSPAGAKLTLRWTAGRRGRYAQDGTVREAGDDGRLIVEAHGPPQIEQLRRFMRGGGGEKIWLRPLNARDPLDFDGRVYDLSERSFRARFNRLHVSTDDPVSASLDLGDGTVDIVGSVLCTRPVPDSLDLEVVVVFDAGEVVAQVIRRYLLRLQMLARARTADG
jgi:hypothetical protein